MKKYGSLIALGVVIVLAIVVATTRKEPVTEVKAPYSIKKVENLTRIEVTQAGENGGLVVLTKDAEDWALTKPVEAPLTTRIKDQLAESVKDTIRTDDINLDAAQLADYDLGEDKATKVAFYAKDADAPATEFFVGKAFTVEGTRAKRTYIKTGDGKVYRAQTDLGDIVTKPIDQLRSKDVQKLDRKELKEIAVSHADGTILRLANESDEWKLREPQVDFELERSVTNGLANGVANLVATGFVDDKQPADVGLDPWSVKVVAVTKDDKQHVLLVSPLADGKAFVKTGTGTHIFEISERQHGQLAVDTLALRSRLAKDLEYTAVKQLDFLGGVSIKKVGEGEYAFAKGGSGKVAEQKLNSKMTSLVKLRALRFETPDESVDTGLGRKSDRVVLTMDDGSKHTLLIGNKADEKGNLWAKWDDSDLVMVVPQWVRERSSPNVDDLADSGS